MGFLHYSRPISTISLHKCEQALDLWSKAKGILLACYLHNIAGQARLVKRYFSG